MGEGGLEAHQSATQKCGLSKRPFSLPFLRKVYCCLADFFVIVNFFSKAWIGVSPNLSLIKSGLVMALDSFSIAFVVQDFQSWT